MLGLEGANIRTDALKVGLFVVARDEVIGALRLVRSNEIWVVDARKGGNRRHVGCDLALQVVIEYLGAIHSFIERERADVPTAQYEVVGVYHGEHIRNGNVNIFSGARIRTKTH